VNTTKSLLDIRSEAGSGINGEVYNEVGGILT
jgi:hypothetical protein